MDVPYPTQDKPQSKMWYSHGTYWALLPTSAGPSLWKRAANGAWNELHDVSASLAGLPAQADAWYGQDTVTAVAVNGKRLSVFRIDLGPTGRQEEVKVISHHDLPMRGEFQAIETSTIARDASGIWWVAADVGEQIAVWHSEDGYHWSEPQIIAEGIHTDDISVTFPVAGDIGVIWSDQIHETVWFRTHRTGAPLSDWAAPEPIEQGMMTADDHLNVVTDSEGRIWVATKNSVDEIGKPQLVMRVRETDGTWQNLPYAPLGSVWEPSRPIVVSTPEGLLTVYTMYHATDRTRSEIVAEQVNTGMTADQPTLKTLLATSDLETKGRLNDVTGPKAPFADGAPRLVLTSDQFGNVYEMDLKGMY